MRESKTLRESDAFRKSETLQEVDADQVGWQLARAGFPACGKSPKSVVEESSCLSSVFGKSREWTSLRPPIRLASGWVARRVRV